MTWKSSLTQALGFFKGYPDALDDIAINKHELLRCSFETGPSIWDVTTESRKYCSSKPGKKAVLEVYEALKYRADEFINMAYPLSPWTKVIAEEILPEFFDLDQEVEPISDDWLDLPGPDSEEADGTDGGEDEEPLESHGSQDEGHAMSHVTTPTNDTRD